MMNDIELCPFCDDFVEEIWRKGYVNDEPEWSKTNAPYFNEYKKFETLEVFKKSDEWKFLQQPNCKCIVLNNIPVGMVSKYWIDQQTKWLEIGIIIYDDNIYNRGIGYQALVLWIQEVFEQHQEIEHIGLTTWSGNHSMIRLSEKLRLVKEAQIRKVRFYKGIYYDSIKYGILRAEWYNLMSEMNSK